MDNETLRKAIVLMQSALKQYMNDDFETAEHSREEANKMFDNFHQYESKDRNLYGENRNFGIIYHVIEGNTSNLNEDKKKRKAYKEIVNLIKEDKNLKLQFDLYNAFSHPQEVANVETFINEAINLLPQKRNAKSIVDSNTKLLSVIQKNNLNEFIDINDDDMKLYESVEYVLLNKPTYSNLNKYGAAKQTIAESVKRTLENQKEETKETYDDVANSIAENYNNILNDDEKELIEQVATCKNKEKLFNDKKNETLKALKEAKRQLEDKEKINEVIDSVNEKQYNESTILKDIAEFIEIGNVINTEDN